MREICQCINNQNKGVSIIDTIKSIKNAGYKKVFVQWYDREWEVSQQVQLDYCRELGLEIEFAHLGYDGINSIWLDGEEEEQLVKKYLRNLDECSKNNINLVVMHLQSKSTAPEPNEIGLSRFQKIADYARQLNIKIAFENTKLQGYLEYIFDNIKNDNIGICFDIGHCHCFFKDDFSWEKFSDKIFAVHLHDNDGTDDQHRLPFDGTIDWQDFMFKLKTANYTGPITLESCYSNFYIKQSLQEFYVDSFKRAEKLKAMIEA